jgi:hypothetical protein
VAQQCGRRAGPKGVACREEEEGSSGGGVMPTGGRCVGRWRPIILGGGGTFSWGRQGK